MSLALESVSIQKIQSQNVLLIEENQALNASNALLRKKVEELTFENNAQTLKIAELGEKLSAANEQMNKISRNIELLTNVMSSLQEENRLYREENAKNKAQISSLKGDFRLFKEQFDINLEEILEEKLRIEQKREEDLERMIKVEEMYENLDGQKELLNKKKCNCAICAISRVVFCYSNKYE